MSSNTQNSMAAFITLVPEHFFPAIGEVMVSHAWLDRKLNEAIYLLAGMDHAAGVSVLSPVSSTQSRALMLQNLARTKATDLSKLCKILVLGDLIAKLSEGRNYVAHGVPYSWSPSEGKLFYHRDTTLTNPQITQKPAYTATIASLGVLSQQLVMAGTWLGMLMPSWLPDGFDPKDKTFDEIRAVAIHHDHWDDDARFPWQPELTIKLKKEGNKPLNDTKTRTPGEPKNDDQH